jgi:uridine phosphorylase
MEPLYHLTAWPYAEPQALSPPSLREEGFVHLSSGPQLLATARRWFVQQQELAVLVLDPAALPPADLRWEDLYGHGQAFPHLYSAIPPEAVQAVVKLARSAQNGDFIWPPALAGTHSPLMDGPDQGPAMIEPAVRFAEQLLPPLAVLNFFPRVMRQLLELPQAQVHRGLGSPIGPDPVVVLEMEGQSLAVCSPGVGGPLAGATLEELIALGCRRFVMCGGAGSLHSEQPLGALVLVEEAVRDEGLSHHYLPPQWLVTTEARALSSAAHTMSELGVPFRQGRSWTTDAVYRETPARVQRRRQQACLTVEMEAASLLAVARYRQVPLVPILYCGDDLGSEQWDFRDWTSAHDVQERLFWLAARVALGLPD